MISVRIRSLATTYARDCVRSATAAGGSGYRGGGVRVSTAVAARAFSSTLPSAQPPLPSNLDATGDQAHAEEGLDASHPGQELHRNEKAEGVVELLQRHAQAREEWTHTELSGHERARISKDLVGRIRSLSKAKKSTKVGVAIEILDEGRRQGVKSLMIYRAVLKQLLSTYAQGEAASENLERILERMREDGLQPDLKTYNHILDFHGAVHNSEEAVAVYEELLSRGFEPDHKTVSFMIVAHSRGRHDDMFRAVEEMNRKGWKGSRAAYLGMIAVMGIRRDHKGILDTMRRMREESKKPTEAAFFGAFRAAEHLAQVDTAKQLFEHRIEVGLQPQEYAYVKMMVMLLKDGRAEEALEYWRQLVCVNGLNEMQITPETYNLAVKCAAWADSVDEMEAVVEMMEAQGVVPTEKTYVAALTGFEGPAGSKPRMEGAKRAFAAIAKTGLPPGRNLLQRTAVAYAHAGMWQEALDIFEHVVEADGQLSPRDWKCFIMSRFELGKYEEVKEAWALSTEGRGTSHSYRAFEYAIKAAGALQDADWALQLREAAGNGGKGSADLDRMVVAVLLTAGRLQEARSVLKVWETLELRGPNIRALEDVYQIALAACAERGDAELALDFFDGMQSATPPHQPRLSCPSFEFVLRCLKDGGRAREVKPLFDEVCQSQGADEAPPSVDCHAVVAEAMSMDESD